MPLSTQTQPIQLDFLAGVDTTQVNSDPVHIVPSAARKSAALGLFKYWRVYALLKHIDRTQFAGHSRFLITDDIINQLAVWCGLKPITIRRILTERSIQGIFWSITRTSRHHAPDVLHVRLEGRHKVEATLTERALAAEVYDAAIVSRCKGLLQLEDFRSLAGLEAQCFDAWLAARKQQEFTGRWVDLESAWGRERTTLKHWLELAGVTVIHNYATIPLPFTSRDELLTAAVGASYDNYIQYQTIDGTEYLVFQRANTYVTADASQAGRRGKCRDIASHLQRAGLDRPTKYVRTNHDLREQPAAKRVRRLDNWIKRAPDRRHYTLKVAAIRQLRRGRSPTFVNRWRLEYTG